MSFVTGRISLRDAWELTRGRFWQLLGMIVLAVVFYVMVWLLFFVIGSGGGWLSGGERGHAGPQPLDAADRASPRSSP